MEILSNTKNSRPKNVPDHLDILDDRVLIYDITGYVFNFYFLFNFNILKNDVNLQKLSCK